MLLCNYHTALVVLKEESGLVSVLHSQTRPLFACSLFTQLFSFSTCFLPLALPLTLSLHENMFLLFLRDIFFSFLRSQHHKLKQQCTQMKTSGSL